MSPISTSVVLVYSIQNSNLELFLQDFSVQISKIEIGK